MHKAKKALSYILYLILAAGMLAAVYVIFSHLTGPKAGESCGYNHRWVYIGPGIITSHLSCELDH